MVIYLFKKASCNPKKFAADGSFTCIKESRGHYYNSGQGINFSYQPADMTNIIDNTGVKNDDTHIAHISRFIFNYLFIDLYVDKKTSDLNTVEDYQVLLDNMYNASNQKKVNQEEIGLVNQPGITLQGYLVSPEDSPSYYEIFAIIERKNDLVCLQFFVPQDAQSKENLQKELGKQNGLELVNDIIGSLNWEQR
ncbi:MAG: hypothetical protein WCJ58_08295 [bacterium]